MLCRKPAASRRPRVPWRAVGGLSALPSSAPTGVDRLLPFFTSFPFIRRFCLDLLAADLYSGTPSALRCYADGRRRAKTKRNYYTKWRGNLPCRLRPIPTPSSRPAAFGVRRFSAALVSVSHCGACSAPYAVMRRIPSRAGDRKTKAAEKRRTPKKKPKRRKSAALQITFQFSSPSG